MTDGTTDSTAESKIDATHRLEKAGLWKQASLYRDEQRQRLRAEGMTRKEAREEAWVLMIERYPEKGAC